MPKVEDTFKVVTVVMYSVLKNRPRVTDHTIDDLIRELRNVHIDIAGIDCQVEVGYWLRGTYYTATLPATNMTLQTVTTTGYIIQTDDLTIRIRDFDEMSQGEEDSYLDHVPQGGEKGHRESGIQCMLTWEGEGTGFLQQFEDVQQIITDLYSKVPQEVRQAMANLKP